MNVPLQSIGYCAELRFATDWPVWGVLGLAALIGVGTMVLYLRESHRVASPWSWLLPGIRATAIVLAFLMLAGPVWHRRQIIGAPARVVWALDRSASMSESDSQTQSAIGGSRSRLRRATDRLFGSADQSGWIEDLDETHLMEVVVFDQTSTKAWDSELPRVGPEDGGFGVESQARSVLDSKTSELLSVANGNLTDLSAPLTDAMNQTLRQIPDQVQTDESASAQRVMVLMSDGRESVGQTDSAEIAERLAQTGWQVHTVGMGSLEEPPDIGVVDVDVPQRVADDGRLAGQVMVKHFGHADQSVRVQIRSGDTIVWSESIEIQLDGKTAVPFDFPVEELMSKISSSDLRGVNRDSVVLPLTAEVSLATDDETVFDSTNVVTNRSPNNNTVDFRVAAASRDRELLILDGSSRWEMRYLRNLFMRDPAWRVDTVLFGAGTDKPSAQRGEEPGQMPNSARAWATYDAVILGEVPPDQWTAEDSQRLSEFVSRGGGLIVVDGRYDRIKELVSTVNSDSIEDPNPLAGLIPVRFDSIDLDAISSEDATPSEIDFIVPTDSGVAHPVMLLDSDSKPIEKAWQSLPAPTVVSSTIAMPDAEVWAEAVDKNGGRRPWLVTRLFGAGRVFYLASDQTWRWRYKLESRLHRRFWNQLMTAAMQPPYAVRDEFVAIGTDKIDYAIGQPATIRARLLQENVGNMDGELMANTTVDALLLKDDQIVATIPMRLEDAQRRTYIGQTQGLPEGQYDVRVRASGFDADALKASSPIWVQPPRSGELDRTSVDETTLKRIAQAGGGTYVHESSLDDLYSRIAPMSRGRIVESDTALWQTWWVFLLIVSLLAIEWCLRKKVGLV